ncbi:ribosomal-protein-alanine N-acetyltransferase [Orenia metallireducens]|uniref:[Ribosomal protein bS18]-alanine N-acetyltransferase n=1 Tax=Orenia metallireducens TaxID=1413210 RepID=A0A1C0ABK4_9FIRM|nr:ribosomal protein S18-alanine N-acetyltransferase [Orenia metallireducens]OCL27762.1 ribosomal-protein-alanine N-acetyltransferase [Orenia metallireducens]
MELNNLEIRPMVTADIQDILMIEEESFSSPWSKNAFMSELKNQYAYYLVASIGDKLVAYIGAWLIFEEAHITTLAVAKEYRRQGIATLILEELFKDVRENQINKATLEVRVSNHKAKKLYLQEGFVEVGVRKNYYSDNKEDAVIMWKQL